jgi:lysozyme
MKLPSRLLRGLVPVVAVAVASCALDTSEDVGSNESAVVVCGQTTVKGIDVYHGDNGGKPINWPAVKGAGISFAFAKATESTNFTDSAFATNWPEMKAAGLVRGAYHFFHSDVDPVAQANFFLATVGKVSKGDLLVLDLEQTNGQTQTTVSSRAATFLATVKSATGVTPLLYTSPAFLSSFAAFGAYPLWVANYGVNCPNVPSPWSTYTFWQSTGTGSLSVISGAVDLDTFNGTLAQLQAFADGTSSSDGGTMDAGSTDAGATEAATGSEPNPDGGAPDSGANAALATDGGCACTVGPRDARGSSQGAVAALVGIALLGLRRARRGHFAQRKPTLFSAKVRSS